MIRVSYTRIFYVTPVIKYSLVFLRKYLEIAFLLRFFSWLSFVLSFPQNNFSHSHTPKLDHYGLNYHNKWNTKDIWESFISLKLLPRSIASNKYIHINSTSVIGSSHLSSWKLKLFVLALSNNSVLCVVQ